MKKKQCAKYQKLTNMAFAENNVLEVRKWDIKKTWNLNKKNLRFVHGLQKVSYFAIF